MHSGVHCSITVLPWDYCGGLREVPLLYQTLRSVLNTVYSLWSSENTGRVAPLLLPLRSGWKQTSGSPPGPSRVWCPIASWPHLFVRPTSLTLLPPHWLLVLSVQRMLSPWGFYSLSTLTGMFIHLTVGLTPSPPLRPCPRATATRTTLFYTSACPHRTAPGSPSHSVPRMALMALWCAV